MKRSTGLSPDDLGDDMSEERTEDKMPVFVIKAKDALAPEAVAAYRDLCTRYGLHGQASEVQLALNEIELWQQDNADALRFPDHTHVPLGAFPPTTGEPE